VARRTKRRENVTTFDYSLLFIVLFLLGFGLIMLYSTSSYEAAQDYGDSAYFLMKQIRSIIVGFVLMIGCIIVPYQFWEKFYGLAYIVSAGLIALIIPFAYP
jgi:cell division protein FtsW